MRKKQCPACLEEKVLASYYVYPKRHFGDTPLYVKMCPDCIKALDAFTTEREFEILSEKGQLPDFFYVELMFKFIRERNGQTRKKKKLGSGIYC